MPAPRVLDRTLCSFLILGAFASRAAVDVVLMNLLGIRWSIKRYITVVAHGPGLDSVDEDIQAENAVDVSEIVTEEYLPISKNMCCSLVYFHKRPGQPMVDKIALEVDCFMGGWFVFSDGPTIGGTYP